ncbi:hypothetical protein EK21DRAFT_118254 [Setomelanomma holmii]|uniref:Heterokaryon incompatibility domain-containing protein n=1 Tax=Setomelanomma holmii TaxID=210430 RepID=A0A9P4GWG1_9PLEO|nr:hypothetical protein EK21DRAFT_118254 [Setomelanomma holmii]
MHNALEQARQDFYNRAVKDGGGALRGLVTQAASADDLRRYFQPSSDPAHNPQVEDMASATAKVDIGTPLEIDAVTPSERFENYDEIFTKPKIVRTEPRLRVLTEEYDTARALIRGISWIHLLGTTTASRTSYDVAAIWLKRGMAEEDYLASNFATNDHRDTTYSPPSSPNQMFPFSEDGSFVADNDVLGTERGEGLKYASSSTDVSDECPSRLLEINEHATYVRLIETSGQKFTYVALSYCWGKDDAGPWKTTRSTIESHMKTGLDTCLLPLTLQRSLKITRGLGLHYI